MKRRHVWHVVAYPVQGFYQTFGPFYSEPEARREVKKLLAQPEWERAWPVYRGGSYEHVDPVTI